MHFFSKKNLETGLVVAVAMVATDLTITVAKAGFRGAKDWYNNRAEKKKLIKVQTVS